MSRAPLLAVLALLWVLLAASVSITFANLPYAVMTGLVMLIAACQAVMVLWFDMRLGEAPGLVRLVAFGAVGWLTALYGLGLADWLTR